MPEPQPEIVNPDIILASGLAGPYVHYPVAVEKGFFAKYGLNAELRIFASGFEAVQAVGAGEAHISNAGEFSLLGPHSRGADIVVVGRNIVNFGDLGVGAVEGISGPDDLIGKTCAAVLGGTGEWYVHRYQTVYDIDPADMTVLHMAAPEWLPTMARGDIDCFFGWEPWLTQLPDVVSGGSVIHRNADDGVYVLQNFVGFNQTWIEEDPAGAAAAMLAMIDTMEWVNDNRQEAAEIAAEAMQLDADQLVLLMECCVYDMAFPQQVTDAAQNMGSWAEGAGVIEISVDELVASALFPDLIYLVAPERCEADICPSG